MEVPIINYGANTNSPGPVAGSAGRRAHDDATSAPDLCVGAAGRDLPTRKLLILPHKLAVFLNRPNICWFCKSLWSAPKIRCSAKSSHCEWMCNSCNGAFDYQSMHANAQVIETSSNSIFHFAKRIFSNWKR